MSTKNDCEVFVLDMTRGLGDEAKWNIQEVTGYTPKTTFYNDFAIADIFGAAAVADTAERAFKEWRDNVEYLTELVLVLNHRGWMHYHAKRMALANIYFTLWERFDSWCGDNLTGEDLDYYLTTTD